MDHSRIIFPSCLTGARKSVCITSIIWLLSTILLLFVIPSFFGYIVAVFRFVAVLRCGVSFLVVPVVNYIKTLVAVRRHHSQLGDTIASQQMSIVTRREKKVALDMWIVAMFLSASLVPILLMKIFELRFPRVHSILLPWSLTIPLMKSSINPLFYGWRNGDLRSALKSMIRAGTSLEPQA